MLIKDQKTCPDEMNYTISSIDEDNHKFILLPTRDTQCEKRKKECQRQNQIISVKTEQSKKQNLAALDQYSDNLPPKY